MLGKQVDVVGEPGSRDGSVLIPLTRLTLPASQVLKSTADVAGGRALYEAYSAVTDNDPQRFLSLRHTVLLRKEARKLFVQANTRLERKALPLPACLL